MLILTFVMFIGIFRWPLLWMGSLVAIIALLIGLFITTYMGRNIRTYLNEKGLRVTGPLLDVLIPYEEMKDVVPRRDVDWGTRIAGYAGIDTIGGNFVNKEFGRYKAGAYLSTPICIVVSYGKKRALVFNLDSSAGTEQVYRDLIERKESIVF